MYAFEASRPDATNLEPGSLGHRPCSAPDRQPWVNVRAPEAAAACAAIGARLCFEEEWADACRGSRMPYCTYSYSSACNTYSADVCNGNEHDADSVRPGDQDELSPTGAFSECYVQWGADTGARIFDLSGNVKEWTAPRASGINPLPGRSVQQSPGRVELRLQLHGRRRYLSLFQRRFPLLSRSLV